MATYYRQENIPAEYAKMEDPEAKAKAKEQLERSNGIYTMVLEGSIYGFSGLKKAFQDTAFYIGGNGAVYKNSETSEHFVVEDILDKSFVIEVAKRTPPKWEIGEETKEILGKKCVRATCTPNPSRPNMRFVAWFCPELPVIAGPAGTPDLPGMVLQLDNVRSLYTCASIQYHPRGIRIVPPEGKRVTAQEFRGIYQSFMQSMGIDPNGKKRIHVFKQQVKEE